MRRRGRSDPGTWRSGTWPRPAGLPLSAGTYLALAALNRLVAPFSKAGFADWWKSTAADRFAGSPPARWITGGSMPRTALSRS